MCAYGREAPWRGPARPRPRRCRTRRSPRRRRACARRRRRAGVRAAAVDVLEAEQDHGDVVAPAGVVGGGDQLAAGAVELGHALHHGPHADLVDHRRQAVRAQQVDVAAAGGERLDVDLHLALGAERARDHRALRVRLRLLLGELAAGHELADQRVVAREPRELAVAPQVGARVADVGDRDLGLADVGGRAGRAHAGGLLVGARAVVDAAVGLLDDPHEAVGGRAVAEPGVEGLDRHLRGDLAGLGAAHAVGDHEQRRADEVVVLVALALAAQVGGVELFCRCGAWLSARR